MCEHTSSPCQTFARLSSLGGIWIVSCHPCSGGKREGRGKRLEGGGKGRIQEEVVNVNYVDRDDMTSLDMQWRNSLADCLD